MKCFLVLEPKTSKLGIQIAKNQAEYCDCIFVGRQGITKFGDNIKCIFVSSEKFIDMFNSGWDMIINAEKNKILNNSLHISAKNLVICSKNQALNIDNARCIISCGYSNKNTVTMSCCDCQNYVFALQREVVTVNNNIIKPCEFKVSIKSLSPEQAMVAVGAMVILDIPLNNSTIL